MNLENSNEMKRRLESVQIVALQLNRSSEQQRRFQEVIKKPSGIFNPFHLSPIQRMHIFVSSDILSIFCIKNPTPPLVFTILICLFAYGENDANIITHANNGLIWKEFAVNKLQTRLHVSYCIVLIHLYNINGSYDLNIFCYIFVIEQIMLLNHSTKFREKIIFLYQVD